MKTVQPETLIGISITCAETGKQFIGARDGISTNYARDSKGNIYSEEGVDIRERRDLLDRSKPFVAYISNDNKRLTGWKGNVLGAVISQHTIRNARKSFVHGDTLQAYIIRDIHGGLWYGRGNAGMCITIRAYKGK